VNSQLLESLFRAHQPHVNAVQYCTVHLIRRVIIVVMKTNTVRTQRCNDPMLTADVRKDVVSMVMYDLVSATVVVEETAEALVPLGFS
jgi:glycerol-3-phosphate cytidylyltransferase-like family protein